MKFKDCYAQTEFWVSIEGKKVKRFLQIFVTMTSHVQESNFIGVSDIYDILMVSQKKSLLVCSIRMMYQKREGPFNNFWTR